MSNPAQKRAGFFYLKERAGSHLAARQAVAEYIDEQRKFLKSLIVMLYN